MWLRNFLHVCLFDTDCPNLDKSKLQQCRPTSLTLTNSWSTERRGGGAEGQLARHQHAAATVEPPRWRDGWQVPGCVEQQ